jgi:hypothetical protein
MAIKNSVDSVTRELEAARNQPETANETRRAEQDLKAQKDSAKWAMVMGLMALISTIVSGVGLIYLWKTVQYTREAALHARATLHSGRAWVLFKGHTFDFSRPLDAEEGYLLSFNAINAGNTPALNVKYVYRMEPVALGADIMDIPLEHDVAKKGKTVGQSTSILGPPCFISNTLIDAMNRSEIHCIFRCLITYRDIYEPNVLRETDAWFKVSVNGVQTFNDGRPSSPRFMINAVEGKEERAT